MRTSTALAIIFWVLAIIAVLSDRDEKLSRLRPYDTTVELPNGQFVTGKPVRE